MSKKKKIGRPWCIYSHGTPTGIGKIVEESKNSASILYSEGQHYSPEAWDMKSLQKFTTITAAIAEFRKHSDRTFDELKKVMISYFPSKAKEIKKIQEIEKPWCVMLTGAVGKVETESEVSAHVIYCEGQLYPSHPWDHKWLKRYKTIREAINKYAEMEGMRLEDAARVVSMHFPSERKAIEKYLAFLKRKKN